MNSGKESIRRAQASLKPLLPSIGQAALTCPLCGTTVPARGLRLRSAGKSGDAIWQLVFICPACGLVSGFSLDELSVRRMKALTGSAWTGELRRFFLTSQGEQAAERRVATPQHFIGVFVISFLTWFVLTGSFNPVDLLWGLVVSLAVARFSHRFVAFDLPRWVLQPRRWLPFLDLLLEFTRQLILQNLRLSIRVLSPKLKIKPGIVAVPTKLRGDINLTLLGSLMSLTPDTVTLDIDPQESLIYVHWIDVQTTDPQHARRLISADLEERIIRWLL